MLDLIVALVLIVSCIVGLARGAVRELVSVLAFVFAIIVAVAVLRFTLPVTYKAVHIVWLAEALALLIVFIAAFIVLKVLGGGLTRQVRNTPIVGPADRVIGLGFGLIRGLITVGLLNLLLTVATPEDRRPDWVTNAKLYPVTAASAAMLRAVAPKGFAVAHQFTHKLGKAVDGARDDSLQDNDRDTAYEAPTRKHAD
jgi:membrane protein required for colicin V production